MLRQIVWQVPPYRETNRKLIKTVNMTVETEDYDGLLNTLDKKIAELGGYTEYFSTQGNSSNRYGSMTIRIPKEKLNTFLEMVEGVSNITYRQENVEDVTLDYVDVESRKKMLETEQQRLLELLETAESLDDILTIESRLTEVQYELDSKESQLRTYDNQIDYSTVYLDINEVVRYTPQEQKGTWERISTGFRENLYSVGNGIKNFFIQFIIHIPSIVVFLAMVGILALIVRFIIRMEQKHSQRVQEKKKETTDAASTADTEHTGRKKKMQENKQYKSGFAALIGRPNVGKSTLMNCLIGQKIAITSKKPQTTRNKIQTVYTSDEGQIVFVDTPGIHKAKNKLGDYMVNVAEHSLKEVDVVIWLVEPTDYIGAGEQHIVEQLSKVKVPVILVVNKIDTVKREQLLVYIDAYRKLMDFAEIVPVSALKDDNTDTLIKLIMKYLPYGLCFL